MSDEWKILVKRDFGDKYEFDFRFNWTDFLEKPDLHIETFHFYQGWLQEDYRIETSDRKILEYAKTPFDNWAWRPNGPGTATITITGLKSKVVTKRVATVTGEHNFSAGPSKQTSDDWECRKTQGPQGPIRRCTTKMGLRLIIGADVNTWLYSADDFEFDTSDHDIAVVALRPAFQVWSRGALFTPLKPGEVTVISRHKGLGKTITWVAVILPDATITITGPDTVAVGESIELRAASTDETETRFKWKVSDKTALGLVELNGGAGARVTGLEARQVTVTAEGLKSGANGSKTIKVFVSEKKVVIHSDGEKETVAVDETLRLWAKTEGGDDYSYTWTSSEPEVIAVLHEQGEVTEVKGLKGGVAVITAKGLDTELVGTKQIGVPFVEVTGDSFIKHLESKRLKAETKFAEDRDYTWESSHPEVGDVNGFGDVNGRAEGTAKITAKGADSGVTGSKVVAVSFEEVLIMLKKPETEEGKPEEKVPLGPSEKLFRQGEKLELFLIVSDRVEKAAYDIYIGLNGPSGSLWLNERGKLVLQQWPLAYRKNWTPSGDPLLENNISKAYSEMLPAKWSKGEYAWVCCLNPAGEMVAKYLDNTAMSII